MGSACLRQERFEPSSLRAFLSLLIGLLACLALAQGPGGGLELVSVTGGASDEGYGLYPYGPGYGGYGGYAHAGFYADCDGQITYKYKWNKAFGPPPQQAIVHLQSDANLEGESGDECADGLGDDMVAEDRHGTYTARSYGERYRIMNLQGDTLEVKLTPHAYSASLASVWVRVDAAPVVVTLGGPRVTDAGSLECMVGKGIQGGFSAGGYHVHEDSYQWSIGGSNFKDYVHDDSSGQAHLYNLESSDLQAASPHWFWKDASTSTVSCTGTVDLPDGSSPSVSAQTQVDVIKPYSAFAANTSGSMYFNGNFAGSGAPNAIVSWNPSVTTGDLAGNGIVFRVAVGTPPRLWEGGDSGQHCYAQLANIDDYVTRNLPPFVLPINTGGRWDLDNDFPYFYNGGPDPANSVEPNGPMPNPLGPEDAPALGFQPYDATMVHCDDQYRMFQLYHPPGSTEHVDWAWVPLNVIGWICFGEAHPPYGAAGSPVPNSLVQVKSHTATTEHPVWGNVFVNKGGQ